MFWAFGPSLSLLLPYALAPLRRRRPPIERYLDGSYLGCPSARQSCKWRLIPSLSWALLLTRFVRAVGSDLASAIIRDFEFVVQRIYILIEMILQNFYYLSEITHLATVYCLLTVYFLRSDDPNTGKPSKSKRGLVWLHFLFLAILLGLWIGILYTSIKYRVDVVLYNFPYKTFQAYLNLNLAYNVLYLCATIEVLVWALLAFRKQKTETKVKPLPNNYTHQLAPILTNFQNTILFLALIAIPLLLRSLFYTGTAARSLNHPLSDTAWFVTTLFPRVCTVLAYAGIVLIARQLEKAQRYQQQPGPQNGNGPDITSWQQHPDPTQVYPAPNQGFNSLPPPAPYSTPLPPPQMQMQGSAYAASTAATNSPNAPWASQGYHSNGYAPVPQHGGGGNNNPAQVPIPSPYRNV